MYLEEDSFLGLGHAAVAAVNKRRKRKGKAPILAGGKGKERRQARRANRQSKAAQALHIRRQAQEAQQRGVPPEVVSLEEVTQYRPQIETYVQRQGYQPMNNPAALAAQALMIHENNIQSKLDGGGVTDYERAEELVYDDAEAMQDLIGEPDEFIGDIVGRVIRAGKTALDKVNERRRARGKKPILGGKKFQRVANKIAQNEPIITDTLNRADMAAAAILGREVQRSGGGPSTDVGAAVQGVIQSVKRDEYGQAARRFIPVVIIVVVIAFLWGKGK